MCIPYKFINSTLDLDMWETCKTSHNHVRKYNPKSSQTDEYVNHDYPEVPKHRNFSSKSITNSLQECDCTVSLADVRCGP